VDAAGGSIDYEEVHELHALAAARRRARKNLCGTVPCRGDLWKVFAPVQHNAGCLDPVVAKHSLHLGHNRTSDPEMRVAPMFGILRVSGPFVGDPGSAGNSHCTIDDEQLSMRSVV